MSMIPDSPENEKLDEGFRGRWIEDLSKAWHKTAPADVRAGFEMGDPTGGAEAWIEHLARRKSPVALEQLIPKRRSRKTEPEHPLQWALTPSAGVDPFLESAHGWWAAWSEGEDVDADEVYATAEEHLMDLSGFDASEVEDDVQAPSDGGPAIWLDATETIALRALVWAHAMPRLPRVLGDTWWEMLDALVGLSHDAAALDIGRHPLTWQMLGGELAWTLAYQFPEIKACRQLDEPGRGVLSDGLEELLDGAGHPHVDHFAILRPLLACWTRSCLLGAHLPKGGWKKKAQEQFEWAVRAAIRTTRPDGRAMLAPPLDLYDAWYRDLFLAAASCSGDEDDKKIMLTALPDQPRGEVKKVRPLELPEASHHSEWSESAVLRTNWTLNDPTLALLYANGRTDCELSLRQGPFWSGEWAGQTVRDGEVLQPEGPWSEVCWVSDDDVDYLELEMPLSGGMRIQRQALLAHSDEFLILADAVLGKRRSSARLQHEMTLPLTADLAFVSPKDTRELTIMRQKQQIRVLPIGLCEWKEDARDGEVSWDTGRLTLVQEIEGHSLLAPLFIDLSSKRSGNERITWRRLTVAEKLATLGGDQAVGYRIQVGDDQWLFYRSLVEPANRTVLGRNLASEMLVARFYEDGSVENLLEIEP